MNVVCANSDCTEQGLPKWNEDENGEPYPVEQIVCGGCSGPVTETNEAVLDPEGNDPMLADIATGNTGEADIAFLVAVVVAACAVVGGLSGRVVTAVLEALLAAAVALTALGLMLL